MRNGFSATGGKCIFTSEWDKFCRITYAANFGAEDVRGTSGTTAMRSPITICCSPDFPVSRFPLRAYPRRTHLGGPTASLVRRREHFSLKSPRSCESGVHRVRSREREEPGEP